VIRDYQPAAVEQRLVIGDSSGNGRAIRFYQSRITNH